LNCRACGKELKYPLCACGQSYLKGRITRYRTTSYRLLVPRAIGDNFPPGVRLQAEWDSEEKILTFRKAQDQNAVRDATGVFQTQVFQRSIVPIAKVLKDLGIRDLKKDQKVLITFFQGRDPRFEVFLDSGEALQKLIQQQGFY